MMPPTSIDGTDITGATIDGTDVTEITVDGDTVFTAVPDIPSSGLLHDWDIDAMALSDGQQVSTITDAVGNEDMSAIGSPTYRENVFNGKDAAEYDGSSDGHRSSGVSVSDPFAIFSVINYTDNGIFSIINETVDQNSPRYSSHIRYDSNNSYRVEYESGNDKSGGTAISDDEIIATIYDSSADEVILRSNGSVQLNGSGVSAVTIDGLDLSHRENSNVFAQGFRARDLVYDLNNLRSDSSVSEVEQALSAQYGIPLN